jgi:hypothetical protein
MLRTSRAVCAALAQLDYLRKRYRLLMCAQMTQNRSSGRERRSPGRRMVSRPGSPTSRRGHRLAIRRAPTADLSSTEKRSFRRSARLMPR